MRPCAHRAGAVRRSAAALPERDRDRPSLVEAHGGLGNALAALDRPHEAVVPFRSVLALQPGHYKANLGLGRVLLDLSQPHTALDHIDRAIAARLDMAEAHVARGRVLVDLHPLNETLVWAARPVRTASANQVRRPLYANAVGRWQPYEPWLAPLLAELRGSAVLHEG